MCPIFCSFQVLQDTGHLLDAGDGLASHWATAVIAALQEGPGSLQAVEATHALAAGVQEDTLMAGVAGASRGSFRSRESPHVCEVHDLWLRESCMTV